MEEIEESLARYVDYRIETGGFLKAVLSNNLLEAVIRADFINKNRIPQIVEYIYNNLPSNCWGNSEKVQEWLNNKSNNEYDIN